MRPILTLLIATSLSTEVLAEDSVASGFHLGLCADAGTVSSADSSSDRLIASTGALELGFQAENGFLVNGIFQGGFWGDHSRRDDNTSNTWETTGGAVQVGWKIMRLRLLAGYQWAAVEREGTSETSYQSVSDGYYYGPNAGVSLVLIDRAGINLDVGTRVANLHWDQRADGEASKNLAVVTSGIHLHLYPSQWATNNRRPTSGMHFWGHLDAARVLLELGPRLTLEILRAAMLFR